MSQKSGSSIELAEMGENEEEKPLMDTLTAECRICQEEDLPSNLETPCSCSGSLKYAHRNCIQRWCDEKRDTTCEICHQTYQPGYTAPAPFRPDDMTIDISGGWTISGIPIELHDQRFLPMATGVEHRVLETQYDEFTTAERCLLESEYDDTSANGSAFCRFAAFTLMILFLLRHALETTTGTDEEDDDDISTFFFIFMMRALGFVLPCYIMAWAINLLQRRRVREEGARLAASEVAFVIQSAQGRGLQVTIVP